jgi:hypothetical protein
VAPEREAFWPSGRRWAADLRSAYRALRVPRYDFGSEDRHRPLIRHPGHSRSRPVRNLPRSATPKMRGRKHSSGTCSTCLIRPAARLTPPHMSRTGD